MACSVVTALRCRCRLRGRAVLRLRPLFTASPAAMSSQANHSVLAVADFLALDAGVVVDVRSPCEFEAGHIPGSVNLPLFTNEERAAVGTCYKQQGRQPAVLLGLAAVGPKLALLAREGLALSAATPGKPLRVTCARGGMRSASVAWLLGTVGVPVVVLQGGYKAFRNWSTGAALTAPYRLLLLGGLTGSGKTEVLAALAASGEAVVDLEALGCHRGSSFGSVASSAAQSAEADENGLRVQPRPEQFENELAMALTAAARRAGPTGRIWMEDEAPNLGRCYIPAALYERMRAAPQLMMAIPMEERVAHLQVDYANASADALCAAAERLRKPLGGMKCDEAQQLIRSGDTASAARILLAYYDISYSHTLATKAKHAMRLNFKPGTTAAQAAASLSVAASALDDDVYAACAAVGAAEATERARRTADKKAAKAENALRRRVQGVRREPPPGGWQAAADAHQAIVRNSEQHKEWQRLLDARLRAFEQAAMLARVAMAEHPGIGAVLESDVELCVPAGMPKDLTDV